MDEQADGGHPIHVVVTLIALVMSLALMVMGVQLYTSLDDKNREALQHASTAFSHVQEQTFSYARMMAGNAVVQRGAWFNSTGMLLDYTGPVLNELKVDIIKIHNKDGVVLALAHNPKSFNLQERDNPGFQMAAGGKTVSRIGKDSQGWTVETTTPVFHETEAERIVGAVTVGYRLDNEMTEFLRDLSGVDVLIIDSGKVVSASLDNVVDVALKPTPSTQELGGISMDVWSAPIQTGSSSELALAIASTGTLDFGGSTGGLARRFVDAHRILATSISGGA